MRIYADYVDITRHRIFFGDKIATILSGSKLDVVAREVPLRLKIIINNLFKDIFLHRFSKIPDIVIVALPLPPLSFVAKQYLTTFNYPLG